MSAKHTRQRRPSEAPARVPSGANRVAGGPRPQGAQPPDSRARLGIVIVAVILVSIVVILADVVIGAISGTGTGGTPISAATPTPAATPTALVRTGPTATNGGVGVVVPGKGGSWTSVSPDQLAAMLGHKDFTLLNVKTPYIGEIAGTDLYIPYDQLSTRAAELPAAKDARILVYCRSGVQSAAAAQTLLDLGYTNVWNLDGGMNAWQATGRTLVNKNR